MAGGRAWPGGTCVAGVGGICGQGACMAGGMHDGGHACHSRYYGIRSMSGQYASYWNAFLLKLKTDK